MPRLTSCLTIALLLATLLTPSAALAQSGNPFTPLPSAQQDDQTQTQTIPETADNNSVDDGGLSTRDEILIFVVGVLLVVGIGYLIMRDARARAPVSDFEDRHRGEDAIKGTRPDPARRKAQSRSKSKAQRRARRHNR